MWAFHKQILQHRIDLILGEIWLGLETLHKLTSVGSYSLHILIKDFDQKTYVAVYDQFKVIMMLRWWYCGSVDGGD